MKKSAETFLTALILSSIFLSTACEHDVNNSNQDETQEQAQLIRDNVSDPAVCGSCHPNHYAEWQQSMHAYAITDPIFQTLSKIGQERTNHELDQFCMKCHTPFGSLMGETKPGFRFENLTPLAGAGISCDVCHTLGDIKRGEGGTSFHVDGIRRGPIADPVANAFHESEFSGRYKDSHFCSTCHQVKSPDKSFDIETTNLEWSLSSYVLPGIECQTCHMPTYSGKAATTGPVRDNLHKHTFVGVDYPLVDFPGREETIASVQQLLQNSAEMTVEAPMQVEPSKIFTVSVTINNSQAGHNLPTGAIFERQMWLEVNLTDHATGASYFSTGLLDDNGDLRNYHSDFVAAGHISEDSSLVLYNGKTIDATGRETLFFWEAASVENNTIPALESRRSEFTMSAPVGTRELTLSVRLRFRSFPPYVFREIGREDLISELLIFDMEAFEQSIRVQATKL